MTVETPASRASLTGCARPEGEARIVRWRFGIEISFNRVLALVDGGSETPAEALDRWMRANCRGGWERVDVRGVGTFVCTNDAICAERAGKRIRATGTAGKASFEDAAAVVQVGKGRGR